MDTNQEVWGRFVEGVEDMVGTNAPGGSQLQVFGAPVPFDWGIETGNKNPLEYWNFCNQLPIWNNVAEYAPTGGSLVSSYESFLNKIKQDYDQDLKNQITEATEKLAADVAKIDVFNTTTGAAYKQYMDNQKKTGMPVEEVDAWLTSTGKKLNLDALQTQVQKDTDVTKSLLDQENRQYADAWAAFNNTAYQKLYSDASGTLQTERIYEWSENPTDMTQKLRAGTLAEARTIAFGQTSESYDFSKSWTHKHKPISLPFFSIGKDGTWEQMSTEKSFEGFNASIAFKHFSLVTINPDTGWFDSGYLKTQAEGPYVDDNTVGFAGEATGNQTYFFDGADAILPGMVTGILVGYQPSFKMTTNSSVFEDVYKSTQESGGVQIGPFHFGHGEESKESQITKSETASNTIEGNDTSDVPQIFGVYVKTMP